MFLRKRFASFSTDRAQKLVASKSLSNVLASDLLNLTFSTEEVPTCDRNPYVFILTKNEVKLLRNQSSALSEWLRKHSEHVANDVKLAEFAGKAKESLILFNSNEKVLKKTIFIGADEGNVQDYRTAAHTAIQSLKSLKTDSGRLLCDAILKNEALLKSVSSALCLSAHTFDRYKTPEKDAKPLENLVLSGEKAVDSKNIQIAKCHAAGNILARELGNTHSDTVTPQYLENLMQTLAETHGYSHKVVRSEELVKEDLHLLNAVGQCSAANPEKAPRLIINEAVFGDSSGVRKEDIPSIAIVGKAITFDTGGLNLKPTNFIEDMHLDMCGSAAVCGCVTSLALRENEGLNARPVRVISVLAAAENGIGNNAYKPNAMIRSPKGYVQVGNTDAEGRLALADALLYLQKHYKTDVVLDLATLTGACVVALGEYLAGVFSNDPLLQTRIVESGNAVFERCWPMPIVEEHREEIKGKYSDLNSTGKGRYGGASTAAAFLEKFIEKDQKWAHIDIAGPAMYSEARGYMPAGGTGFGPQLLCEFIDKHVALSE